MTSPSITAQSLRTKLTEQRTLDYLVSVLALLVPLLAYVRAEATPTWVPTWLYLGELTLPIGIVPPFVLAVAVLWRTVDAYRSSGQFGAAELLEGVLGTIVAVLAIYAVWNLNVTTPGVFWAGLPPTVLGVMLAFVVLARDIARRISG